MPDETPPVERATAEPITAVIAERVRYLREQAKMSQADLAAAMGDHGAPWKRATVVNLEKRASGSRGAGAGRDSVTVQELLALALALDVPPLWLLVDPTDETSAHLTKDAHLNPWWALLWVMGRFELGDRHGQEWARGSRALWHAWNLFELETQLRTVQTERDMVAVGAMDGDDLGEQALQRREMQILRRMRDPIVELRRWGFTRYPTPTWVLERAAELGVQLNEAEG